MNPNPHILEPGFPLPLESQPVCSAQTVIWAERKSPVLSSSSLACLAHIPCVNLTSGCAHDCIYCYARGYRNFPGYNKIIIYKNMLEKLKSELIRKRNKPHAVYFSPSSDIFQPIPEVLELSHSILEFLLSKDIGIAFLTKGKIPDETLDLLINHANIVRAQVGIITHDDNVRKMFEPNAASIAIRLKQMAKMASGGIAVEGRVVPILPGITDTPDAIDRLCASISNSGIKRAAISALFLRPAITASLKQRILDKGILDDLFSFYKDGKRLAVHAGHSSVIPLSQMRREEIYNRFRQTVMKYGIDLSVCGCMNPDIGGRCNITGKWPKYGLQPGLLD
ncbi:MAG: radical SAM protein [Dehalococcoidales bacterium]|nr:radical SAM protein [Dehalococcoidales bacterium]